MFFFVVSHEWDYFTIKVNEFPFYWRSEEYLIPDTSIAEEEKKKAVSFE